MSSAVLLLGLASLLLTASGESAVVRRIAFSGNKALPNSAFQLATKSGSPLAESLLALDRSRVQAACIGQGFLWAEVLTELQPVGEDVDILFRIIEGEPAQVGVVTLAGNRMIAGRVLREQMPNATGSFSEAGLQRNAQALIRFYGDNGFPFCRVRPESLRLERPKVSYRLVIDEGPEVRLSDVRFSGKLETRPDILKRMLRLRLNQAYSETETRKRIDRLATDPLLVIKGYEIRQREEEFYLDVSVQERKANRIFGAVAYSPQDRELAGSASLNLDNLFGTRRAVNLTWLRYPGRQDIAFSYTEPWLLNTGISVSAFAGNRSRDSVYSTTELGISGQTEVADGLALKLETGYNFAAAADSALPSSRTVWGGSGLSFDSRDSRGNPSQGIFAAIGTRAGGRTTESGTAAQLRSQLDVEAVVPVIRPWSVSLAVHGRDLQVQDTAYSYDLFELGGGNSLRGYREGWFATRQCAWVNTEVRYRAGSAARLYPFFDAAVVRDTTGSSYGWHGGYGVGIRIESPVGVVGVDYGVPVGTSPLRGKVHFSILTSF